MNITADKLTELENKGHALWSSWAIWEDNYKAVPKFKNEVILNHLHTNCVIIGLNPSKRKDANLNNENWANFHTGVPDKKLHKAFKDTKVWGGFMTDLFREVDTVFNVDNYCRIKKPEIIKEHIKIFRDKLTAINVTTASTFILLGNSVQQYFNFFVPDDFYLNPIIKLRHYSDYRKNWVEEAKEAIKDL